MDIKDFTFKLEKIYEEMSLAFSEYQNSTGLSCLSGCNRCCLNPEIEASMLEMLPMAMKIYQDGKLEDWILKLDSTEQEYCLQAQGNLCVSYNERPSVCRMFGVSGYFDKHHNATLSICRHIKEAYPEVARERIAQANVQDTPMLSHWSSRLSQLDPALNQDRLPINKSLRLALEKIALYSLYQATSD